MVNSAKDSNLGPFNSMLQLLNIKCDLTPRETYNQLQAIITKLREEDPENPKPLLIEMVTELYLNSDEGGLHLDTFNHYYYCPAYEQKLLFEFRKIFATGIIDIIKIKYSNFNSPFLNNSLIGLCGKIMEHKVFKLLIRFFPIPETASNRGLLEYFLTLIKSIQTEYSLSYQVLLKNEITTEFVCPLNNFKYHELLLNQLQNVIKFYKQIETDTLIVTDIYKLIIQTCQELNQVLNDEKKYKLLLLSIIRYVELLSLYENIKKTNEEETYEELKIQDNIIVQEEKEINESSKTDTHIEEEETKINKINNKINELNDGDTKKQLLEKIQDSLNTIKEKDSTINSLKESMTLMTQMIEKLNADITKLNAENSHCKAEIEKLNTTVKEVQSDNIKKTEQIHNLSKANNNNQRLSSQLIQKHNLMVETLKNEKNKRIKYENLTKSLNNKNKFLLNVIKDLNSQIDQIKVDLKLISKRGYLKILIGLCNIIQLTPEIQKKLPNLSKETNKQLLIKIKGILNYIAHNPKILIGEPLKEQTFEKLFEDIKNYFVFDNQIDLTKLNHIYKDIESLPQ